MKIYSWSTNDILANFEFSYPFFVTIISKIKTLVETRNFYDPLSKILLYN